MPNVIPISGIIGWEITAEDIRKALNKFENQDIEVQISSPGGTVVEGLEIFNLLKKHEGKVTTRLMGLAASMASYIALAGDHIIAEDNAIFMIHNARGVVMGDQNQMRKTADIIEGISNLLANAYSAKSLKSKKEIIDLMNAETYMFGDEIKDEGFVDEIAESGIDTEKDEAVAIAKLKIDDCDKKIKELEEPGSIDKIAAMIGDFNYENPFPNEHAARIVEPSKFQKDSFRRKNISKGIDIIVGRKHGEDTTTTQAYRFSIDNFTAAQARKWLKDHDIKFISFEEATNKTKAQGTIPAEGAGKNKQEVSNMTIDEFKAQNPDLYNQVYKSGEQAGIEKERDRVKAHLTLGKQAGAMDAAIKHIEAGDGMTQTVTAEYLAAGMNKTDLANRQADDDNIGDLSTSDNGDDGNAQFAQALNEQLGLEREAV